MDKNKRPNPWLKLVLFLVTFGLCVSIAFAVTLFFVVPIQVERIFGPPNQKLGTVDRIYLSVRLILQEETLTSPTDPNGLPQSFQVQFGEATGLVIQRLLIAGLIPDPGSFRNYMQYSGLDTGIQAGEYTLNANMSPIQIALALQDATPTHVDFNILPGWRLEEIAQAFPTSGLSITTENFLEYTSQSFEGYIFSPGMPSFASLEGFLPPGSYSFERNITLEKFIHAILMNFESIVTPDLREGFTSQGLDIYQAVTLASILQRESVLEEEMPLIASVFYNRLKVGIKLDADSTVQYALGYNSAQSTWWTNPLSWQDLAYDSPYNTYLYAGLPPGPIANPGINALKAVAFPAQSPYFYFRADCDGSGKHRFAVTFEEQLQNACP